MAERIIIAAAAKNGVIGKEGKLPWHIPEDLKHFKRLTTGHPVIMGRKTFESLPNGPLKNRDNIILTHHTGFQVNGATVVHTIEEACNAVKDASEAFVIGGGEIYKLFLPLTDRMYITLIGDSYEADTWFPEWDETQWELIEKIKGEASSDIPYYFCIFQKIWKT